jgi:hypothetical protein
LSPSQAKPSPYSYWGCIAFHCCSSRFQWSYRDSLEMAGLHFDYISTLTFARLDKERDPIEPQPSSKRANSLLRGLECIACYCSKLLKPIPMVLSRLFRNGRAPFCLYFDSDFCSSRQGSGFNRAPTKLKATHCILPGVSNQAETQPELYLVLIIVLASNYIHNLYFTARRSRRPYKTTRQDNNQPTFLNKTTLTDRVPEVHGVPVAHRCTPGPYGLPNRPTVKVAMVNLSSLVRTVLMVG